MVEEKGKQAEERQDKPRLWRPWRPPRRRTGWRVLWAVGTLLALVTIPLLVGLLVVNLEAVKWEDLSRERIEQVALFSGIAVALTTLFVLLAIGGASLGWTGFADKTFWDWLQLLSALAIPVVLAAAGLWFTAQQDQRQQRTETQRAEAERELAVQRAQDEALQAYLSQMSGLLLEKDLRTSEEGSEVRTLARARTVTVIQRLDSDRNSNVIQFLDEAGLIGKGESSIRLLAGADLRGAPLQGIDLRGADLSEADLSEADLSRTDLRHASLERANLESANLERAFLVGTSLERANLESANLQLAFLDTTDLSEARLVQADLSYATVAASNLSNASLRDADVRESYLPYSNLSNLNLSYANLRGANLRGADLSEADLYKADLSDAKLSDAILRDARNVTEEQLEEQAASLKRATMPNGQKYEDWLKSKD
jgi:uncharacterized protein YjbI with pentapeptide repeats